MSEFETTINTLEQLFIKISDKHYGDIEYLEDEDGRYTIAINNALQVLKNYDYCEDI